MMTQPANCDTASYSPTSELAIAEASIADLNVQIDDMNRAKSAKALEDNQRIHVLETRVEDLLRETSNLAARHDNLRVTHQRFRTDVRDVAIRVCEEQSWCKKGLNEVLAELDLELVEQTFRVTLSITATIEIEATDEDAARQQIENSGTDFVQRNVDIDRWDVDEIDVAD